jgi:hypothetical protein
MAVHASFLYKFPSIDIIQVNKADYCPKYFVESVEVARWAVERMARIKQGTFIAGSLKVYIESSYIESSVGPRVRLIKSWTARS